MISARRSIRAGGPGVSFFAFQDVITAVIGIIVIITLVLALGTHSLIPTITPSPADLERHEMLDRLLADLAELKRSLRDESDAETEGALRSRIAALEAQRQALSDRAAAATLNASDTVSEQLTGIAVETAAALADISEKNEKHRQILDELNRKMNELEAAVIAAEQLVAEERSSSKLRLIPDRTSTTKEPILVTVARNEIIVQPFDSAEPKGITGRSGRLAALADAFSAFKPNDHYMVFFFKPSAFSDFEDVLEVARKNRFDVGYDMIGEEVILEFGQK